MSSNSPQKWFNLEELFYKNLDNKLLEKLREKEELEHNTESIMKVTGITDKAVAAKIASMKVSPSTLTAFCLVPLVAVAWASEEVDADERYVIDQAAQSAGLDESGQKLLSGWLNTRPDSELFETWCDYAKSLASSLNEDERKSLREHCLSQATAVAKASGGVLSFGAISANEKATLEKIEAAFG